MLDSIDVHRFTTAQTAVACGITTAALGALLHRGAIALASDEAPEARSPGTGRSRLFSARRVLHVALTADLSGCGLPVATASRMALSFTDATLDDAVAATICDGPAAEPAAELRIPGYLFSEGQTVFRVLWPADGGEPSCSVTTAKAASDGGVLMNGNLRYRATLAVDLDALHARVMGALGMRTPRYAA